MACTSRASPVFLVSLVCLVYLVEPDRPDRPNRPNEQNRLVERMLDRGAGRRECERFAQAEQNHFQRHVEIEVPRGALLGHFNLTEQV